MKKQWKKQFAASVTAVSILGALSGSAMAASSLSRPGEDVKQQMPAPTAEVQDKTQRQPQLQHEVEFTIGNFTLDAHELYLDKAELTRILQNGMGKNRTMSQLNVTLNSITRYCRQHGYPAAAAYVPAQESSDGMIVIKVIPGRYGQIKLDNQTRMKDKVARGFVNGLKAGEIIRTKNLESALYTLSDVSGTRAVGVLSPGKEFGTSDLTVRIEKSKGSNTILYVENYGSRNSGRYRYGLQHNIYDVGGTGGKASVGTMISNADMHNYYANYEALIGHGGTMLGVGYSRMDYKVGGSMRSLGANGVANTYSVFGSRPLYHFTRNGLTATYGYDYRKLRDDMDMFNDSKRKHSHSVHAGINGFERRDGFTANYGATVTTGTLGFDSADARRTLADGHTEGRFTKGEANVTAIQKLGHRADVMVKGSGQIASRNLDGSEEMYLGGANGVRAYPQGEGSGDEGILGTVETRFYTDVPGLVFSTYIDGGHIWFNNDRSMDRQGSAGSLGQWSSGETLWGWGLGLSYTRANDWFTRLDYARRIGDDPNLSQGAKAKGRTWFMMGKIW